MVKKVVILAGGKGTRLPISARDIPKPLVLWGGKSLLEHQIEKLHKNGLHDIHLALHFRADQIIDLVKAKKYDCGWIIEPEPLGTGGAVRLASKGLTEPFMVINVDTLGNYDFPAILKANRPDESLVVSYWKDDARDFGLLRIENGLIREFLEKPKEPVSGYINAGCYIIHPKHLEDLDDGFSMLESDVFPKLAREGKLRAHVHKGFWDDFGTEERLQNARKNFNPQDL